MHAALYPRVSTFNQEPENDSIKNPRISWRNFDATSRRVTGRCKNASTAAPAGRRIAGRHSTRCWPMRAGAGSMSWSSGASIGSGANCDT